nr:MAG TPA: hypothetical protein [Caudoviricetes sp.]
MPLKRISNSVFSADVRFIYTPRGAHPRLTLQSRITA